MHQNRNHTTHYITPIVFNNGHILLAFIRKEIVMKIEKMNIPPKPYKWRVRRPVLSIKGIETNVITTLN